MFLNREMFQFNFAFFYILVNIVYLFIGKRGISKRKATTQCLWPPVRCGQSCDGSRGAVHCI